RMVKGELELEAASTTAMWAEKFPGVGLLADTVFKGKVGGYEMDASLGVKAQLGAGIEGRFVWSESAKSSVYEKEVEKDVVMHARLGIFSEMQSGLDYAMTRVPGLSAPLGDGLSHRVRQEQEKAEGDEGDKSEGPP